MHIFCSNRSNISLQKKPENLFKTLIFVNAKNHLCFLLVRSSLFVHRLTSYSNHLASLRSPQRCKIPTVTFHGNRPSFLRYYHPSFFTFQVSSCDSIFLDRDPTKGNSIIYLSANENQLFAGRLFFKKTFFSTKTFKVFIS